MGKIMGRAVSRRIRFVPNPLTLSLPTRKQLMLTLRVVMAMGVSRDSALALSVSADHLVGRYDLKASHQADTLEHTQ